MNAPNWMGVAAGVALALVALVPRGAGALTLDDLDTGGSFSVGLLTFDNFDVVVAGDFSVDLTDYLVQVIGGGFRIAGPLSSLGGSGTMLISYEVSALSPIIEAASLVAPGLTIGTGAQAWAAEALVGPGAVFLGSLFAFDIEGVGTDPSDSIGFAPVSELSVTKTLQVGGGSFASLSFVEQTFVVPEPMTVLLLAGGLAGLAFAGRRRELLA